MNNTVTETAANIRGVARSALKGNWKQICIGMILYMVIITLVTDVLMALFPNYIVNEYLAEPMSMPIIPYVYIGIISGPMTLGMTSFIMYFFRRRDINPGYMFNGFGHFGKGFGLQFMTGLLSAWPLIIVYIGFFIYMISTVVSSLYYGQTSGAMLGIMFLFLILIIAAGVYMVIKILAFSQAFYLMCNDLMDENLTEKRGIMRCLKESQQLMKGNKGKLFCVQLSFIGWAIVSAIPMIIVSTILEQAGSGALVTAIVSFIFQLPMAGYYAYSEMGSMVFHDILIGKLVARPAQQQIDQNF